VSQADTTSLITVKVIDDGTPGLSATNSFKVTVNPLLPSALSAINADSGQVNLIATGPPGPDYTLLTSTNLVDWETLFTTNPATIPFTFTTTNNSEPQRFYRIQLGP
jgi:hypothetical protein